MPRCSAATEADQAAYVHYKSVIGYLLGMNEDLLPRSTAAAKALRTAVASYQFGPTPEAKELTAALIALLNHTVSGNIFDRVPALFIRYFLGKQWAEWIGIEDNLLAHFMVSPLRLTGFEFSGPLKIRVCFPFWPRRQASY